jgi:hypothetical protein
VSGVPNGRGGAPSGMGRIQPSTKASAHTTTTAARVRRGVSASAATPMPPAAARHIVASMKNRAGTRSPA